MKTEVQLEEGPSVLKNIAQLFEKSDYDEAISKLKKYLSDKPADMHGLHLLGTAYARIGDYLNAENTFKQALSGDAHQADAHFNLGLIHSRQNRLQEAAADFENVIELKPNDVQALNDLGAVYYSLGEIDKGKALFKKALEIDPAYKEAFLNLFEYYWHNNKYNQALEYAYEFLKSIAAVTSGGANKQIVQGEVAAPTVELPRLPAAATAAGMPKIEPPAVLSKTVLKKTSSKAIDLFSLHVPEKLKNKKTGMNIAVVADFNIAGQLTQLFRLINEKTIHRARCIIIQDDYLAYDKDIVLSHNKPEDWETARQIIESADFLHIGRFPMQNDQFPLLKYLKPDNTIIQYFGSELRQNAGEIYNWHKVNKITGLAAWDYTMIVNSPFFYHINMMFNTSRVKKAPKPEGTIRIVHPTTNRTIKKTELFLRAMEKLQGKYDVEPVIIEGKTNEECLEIKGQAHMTYDQISVGIYGVSAIESLAAGHVVFGGISNFAASVYPDNPIVWITPDNLADKIKYYLVNRVEIIERGLAGRAWVEKHHDPQKLLKQHLYLYDLVKHGHRFLESPDEQLLG